MKLALLLALTTIIFCFWLAESKRCKEYSNEEAEAEFEKNYKQSQKHVGKIHKNMKKQGKETKVKTKNERKQLHKKEKDRVNKANKGNPQFCQVLNEFSSLTQEEMEAGFMGSVPEVKEQREIETEEVRGNPNRPNDDENRVQDVDDQRRKRQVPDSVDYRESTGDVENQGGCGTCWAFAGVHVLTGVLHKKAGVTPMTYSKQQMADCITGRTDSCAGGNKQKVWEYLYTNRIQLETDYPYLAADNTCAYTTPEVAETRVLSWAWTGESESEMLSVLAEHPIGVSMNVSVGAFGSYGPFEDGTYGVWSTDESCESTNHAMTAVGYGTDPEYGDYWLIKNSWGTGFGDQGYIKVKRGVNVCNVETYGNYPILSGSCLAQHWQATLQTGDLESAGTSNSVIYIVLHGSEGDSDRIFPDDDEDNFDSPGQLDVIRFNSERVGRLLSIDVGTTSSNGWYMEWMELKDLNNGDVFKFALNNWIDMGDDESESEYHLNVIGALQDWELVVKTGEGGSAGTSDTKISYTIKGTEGTADSIRLDNDDDNYLIGGTDTFTFKAANVGSVTGITVTTTSTNAWYMEWATLTEVHTGITYNFLFNGWLDEDGESIPVSVDLTPIESMQHWTLTSQTSTESSAGTSNEVISITITGSEMTSGAIVLDNAEDNFELGQLDTFAFTTEQLGAVTQILLGTTSTNGWLPDWVKLTDVSSATEYMFTVGQWIDQPDTPELTFTPD